MKFVIALSVVVTSLVSFESAVEIRAQSRQELSKAKEAGPTISTFDKLRPVLLAKTHVPVELPTYLPYVAQNDSPSIYATIDSVDSGAYTIELGLGEGCGGAGACHYGTVRGSTRPLVENHGSKKAVMLDAGIRGYFINFTCGASCDDAAIGWADGHCHYSVSIKAGDKAALIKVANSAVAAARKKE